MKNQHKINRRTFLKLAGGAAVIAGGGFLAQKFDILERSRRTSSVRSSRAILPFRARSCGSRRQ